MSLYDYYNATHQEQLAEQMLDKILMSPKSDLETKVMMYRSFIQKNESEGGDSTKVIALFDKALSNVVEVQARGASVLALTTEDGGEELRRHVDTVLTVPRTETMLLPQLGVLPLQLLAYYVALERGCDIDKPRNLAKSVTVE